MTKFLCTLLVILVSSSPAFAQSSEVKQNQIITFGRATHYYQADRATLEFSVLGLGSTIDEALNQATQKLAHIANKLKKVGVTDKQLETSYFNSAQNPSGKSWWTSSNDFAAAFTVTLTLDTFALIGPIIQELAGEPIEHMSNLRYSLNDDSTKQYAALKAASEDARRKAELIASTLGASIARVLYVEDTSPFSAGRFEVTAVATPSFVFTGKQFPVTSSLRVIFELGYNKPTN